MFRSNINRFRCKNNPNFVNKNLMKFFVFFILVFEQKQFVFRISNFINSTNLFLGFQILRT